MRVLKIYIAFSLLLISCDKKTQEAKTIINTKEIQIPLIVKNKSDANFQLKNGVLFFDEKPYSGTVKDFYEDGNLKTSSEYYLGKRQGKYFGFYSNQNKWFERFYQNGIKTGIHKGWFKDGQQMFEYQLNNNGVYDGSIKDWHFNGQLAKHFHFVDGKEDGSQKVWKLNGKIRANFFSVNGDRHGLIGLKNCVSVLSEENVSLSAVKRLN